MSRIGKRNVEVPKGVTVQITPELITVKETGGATDASKLPGAAASIAIPETFKKTELARKPAEGAVK